MDHYSFWIYAPDKRVYAVWCISGEVYAGVRVPGDAPTVRQASEFASEMTLGCGDWIREEVSDFTLWLASHDLPLLK